MTFKTFFLPLMATASILLLQDCKAVKKSNSSGELSAASDLEPLGETTSSIPENGLVLAEYTALKNPRAIASVAVPSSSPIKGGGSPSGLALAVNTGSESILNSLRKELIQVYSSQGVPTYLTVDSAGSYTIVVYLNSTLGYVFATNGDLAYCSEPEAPISRRSLPIIDCIDIGDPEYIISENDRYTNGQRIRSGSRFYYEDGRTAIDGAIMYYPDGSTLISSSGVFFWRTGNSFSTLPRYPNGNSLYSGGNRIYFSNQNQFANTDGYTYYLSGSSLRDSSRVYYTGSRTLDEPWSNRFSEMFYFNGRTLRRTDGSVYNENDYSTNQVTQALTSGSSRYFIEAVASTNTAWTGIFQTETGSAFTSTATLFTDHGMSLIGASGGGGPGSGGLIPPPPAPGNAQQTASTPNSISVSWSSGGGSTSSYVVRMITNPTSFIANCVGGAATTNTTSTFTNLPEGTTFAVLICAVDSQSVNSTPAVVIAKTGVNVPPPRNLVLTPLSGSAISATWLAPTAGAASYRIVSTKSPTIPTTCTNGPDIGPVTSRTVTGLEDNALYYIGVCSVNASGNMSSPVVASARTFVDPPPLVTGLQGVSNVPGQIDLTWSSGGENTASFAIKAVLAPAQPTDCSTPTGTTTQSSFQLSGLAAGSTYSVMVCSVSINGSTEAGPIVQASVVTPALAGLDFGGAFGVVDGNIQTLNPATNQHSCPAGYVRNQFLGTTNVDTPAYTCYRRPIGGQSQALEFGGVWGYVNNSIYSNPIGGRQACPPGFTQTRIHQTANVDAPLYFCHRPQVAGVKPRVIFGGIFGAVNAAFTVNPATGDQNCAPGFTKRQIYGNNSSGYVDGAAQLCYKIDSTVPIANPTNVAIAADTATPLTALNVSWGPRSGDTVGFRVAFASGTTAPANCSTGTDVAAASTYKITGLTPSTSHAVRVCAYDFTNELSSGVVVVGTTGSVPQPAEVTGLRVGNVTPQSLQFDWNGGGANTASYRVAMIQGTTAPANCSAGTSVGTQTTINFPNLTPSTSYSVRVCALNSSGNSSNGAVLTATTSAPGLPAEVSGLRLGVVTGQSLEFVWNGGGANTSSYRAAMVQGSTPPANCNSATSLGVQTSITYPNLTPATSYSIRVCAANSFGNVSSGAVLTGTTSANLMPPNVTGLRVVSSRWNNIQLGWTSGGGSTASFLVSMQGGAVAPATCAGGRVVAGNVLTTTFVGLTQQTGYSFRVCSVNAAGASSAGVTITAVTPRCSGGKTGQLCI